MLQRNSISTMPMPPLLKPQQNCGRRRVGAFSRRAPMTARCSLERARARAAPHPRAAPSP
jgi:hypothetical protein